jgi:hypothetical protein
MRRTNAESPDTFTAKLGFFDRTFAPHTDRLGVSCRVQANALTDLDLCVMNRTDNEYCRSRQLTLPLVWATLNAPKHKRTLSVRSRQFHSGLGYVGRMISFPG